MFLDIEEIRKRQQERHRKLAKEIIKEGSDCSDKIKTFFEGYLRHLNKENQNEN